VSDAARWTQDAFARLTTLPGVRRVGLALVEGGGRRLRFTASDRDRGVEVEWCHVDAYDDVPLNTAVRTGEPVLATVDDLEGRYAEFVAAQRTAGHVGLAAVPIVTSGIVRGGYVLFFERQQRFDHRQCAELVQLGEELGDGLPRSHRRPRPSAPGQRATPDGAVVAVHEVVAEPAAVGEARHFLRAVLQGWGVDDDTADTATLCLSELVTNAIVHAEGGCLVRVMLHDGVLTTSVRDSGVGGAAATEPPADLLQVHGRGLQVVDALAAGWGHESDASGTSVWFTLDVA
jgi:anti-sigma regulatory factor (Ser/Thr protein kinase)